ncbi:MAG: PLDc_N domain-containing protein [Chloroflexota bacterium]|nr:MAG: PLDc_N domain-containing protein [Chloroflexota bacterium]
MFENDFQELSQYVPLLIPLLIIQLGLVVIALWDLIRREQTRGPKWVWVLVIFFINFIGPIIYLVVGREDES